MLQKSHKLLEKTTHVFKKGSACSIVDFLTIVIHLQLLQPRCSGWASVTNGTPNGTFVDASLLSFQLRFTQKPTRITDLFPTQTVQYVEAKKKSKHSLLCFYFLPQNKNYRFHQISSFSSVPTQWSPWPYLFTKPSGRHEVMFRLQEEVHRMPAGRQGVDQGLCWCWPEGISTPNESGPESPTRLTGWESNTSFRIHWIIWSCVSCWLCLPGNRSFHTYSRTTLDLGLHFPVFLGEDKAHKLCISGQISQSDHTFALFVPQYRLTQWSLNEAYNFQEF